MFVMISAFLQIATAGLMSLPVVKISSPPLSTGFATRREEAGIAIPAVGLGKHDDDGLKLMEYFAVELEIGSGKPQKQSLIIDTSSIVTFMPCAGCQGACGDHRDNIFDPAFSTSFRWEDCESCNLGNSQFHCSTKDTCGWQTIYSDGAKVVGRVFSDLIDFGSTALPVQMVCGMNETRSMLSSQANGIMGLGVDNKSSMVFQIGEQLQHTQVSHCFQSSGSGTLIFGDWALPESMSWTPIKYKARGVEGEAENAQVQQPEFLHQWKAQTVSIWIGRTHVTSALDVTVWDTGTPNMWMPSWLFSLTKTAFLEGFPQYKTATSGTHLICFKLERKYALESFPLFRVELSDGVWLELKPIQYLVSARTDAGEIVQCIDLLDIGNQNTLTLGSTSMLDMLVTYDYTGARMGFAHHSCSSSLLPALSVPRSGHIPTFGKQDKIVSSPLDLYVSISLVVGCVIGSLCVLVIMTYRLRESGGIRYQEVQSAEVVSSNSYSEFDSDIFGINSEDDATSGEERLH